MANDENQAGEREAGAINPDQQKESVNEDRSAAPENEATKEQAQTGGRQETQKVDQVNRNDKKETARIKRGREEWGGYQGY